MTADHRNQRQYLLELGTLVRREIAVDDLRPSREVASLQNAARSLATLPFRQWQLPFGDLRSESFKDYVRALVGLDSSPVIPFTQRTEEFGFLEVDLRDVNFEFDFTLIPEGVLSIFASSGRNRILLDFYEDHGRRVEVEVQGYDWPKAELRT